MKKNPNAAWHEAMLRQALQAADEERMFKRRGNVQRFLGEAQAHKKAIDAERRMTDATAPKVSAKMLRAHGRALRREAAAARVKEMAIRQAYAEGQGKLFEPKPAKKVEPKQMMMLNSARTAAYKRFGPSEALKPLTEVQLEKLMVRMAKNPKRQEAEMVKKSKKAKKSKKSKKTQKGVKLYTGKRTLGSKIDTLLFGMNPGKRTKKAAVALAMRFIKTVPPRGKKSAKLALDLGLESLSDTYGFGRIPPGAIATLAKALKHAGYKVNPGAAWHKEQAAGWLHVSKDPLLRDKEKRFARGAEVAHGYSAMVSQGRGLKNPLLMSVAANPGKKFDLVGSIMAYEGGELDPDGVLRLFSELIKNGQAWTLQGSYGRMAKQLIDAGWISRSGKILKQVNPGAKWHKEMAADWARGADKYPHASGKFMAKGSARAHAFSAMVSETRGMPNPLLMSVAANPKGRMSEKERLALAKIMAGHVKKNPRRAGGNRKARTLRSFHRYNPSKYAAHSSRTSRKHTMDVSRPSFMGRSLTFRPNPSQLATLAKNPKFKQALKLYRKFHGNDPVEIRRSVIPIGGKKITGREFFVSMGTAPDVTYTPPKHSKKYPDNFIHNYGKKPLRVVSADGKTIMDLPGSHKVSDWIRG